MDLTKRFVIEFVLNTTPYQESILDKRFSIARKLYNITLNGIKKRVKEMKKTRRYRDAINNRDENNKLTIEAKDELKRLYKEYRLSKSEFEKDLKKHRKFYQMHIDSQAGQQIADRIWGAFEKVEFGDGEDMHFKRNRDIKTLQGKCNATGITFKNGIVKWNKLLMPVVVETNYEKDALANNEISYCMVKRRTLKNKIRYYAKMVFKGEPPVKYNKYTGEVKTKLGQGRVGLDIGTSTIAISSNNVVNLKELAPSVGKFAAERRRVQRAMDRSKRATNPNNFNADGTVKTGAKNWNYSKRYKKLQHRLRYLYSKETNVRDYEHHLLKKYILSLGDEFYIETMNFDKLKERKKEDEFTKIGRPKKKKRFGKTIGDRAPAKLMTLLDLTLKLENKELIKINTYEARASQFNHIDLTYKKKKLSQRWNTIDGYKVQRDMYSAFLIQHINDDLSSFNLQECRKDFKNFLRLHELAFVTTIDLNRFYKLRVL